MVSMLNCMIFCIVYYANCTYWELVYLIGTYIVQGLIWNYKNCCAQPWLWFRILQALRWSWECIRYFLFYWYRILFWNFEICIISLFSFGWWYTLMKNKHQISLCLGLKKMANISQITFSNGFSLKKISLSVCQSVCLFVCLCLSVCLSVPFTPFSLCSHHGIIMKFSGVITNKRSDVYANGQSQKSKVKVTEVKIQISRFGTITPVWFHIWWWNDAQSLILFRNGALLIFKVICQISRSHG